MEPERHLSKRKNIILYILATFGAGLALFAGVAAMQPDGYHYERSATINAPAPVIFEQVNDLHKWENWSPWAKMDPETQGTYEGPGSGTGAAFSWKSKITGEGKMTITESVPNELIKYRLEFYKPFKGESVSEFALKPGEDGTIVTWSMHGKNNFIGKAMGLIMNCEKMMMEQFEEGLDSIKIIAEGNP